MVARVDTVLREELEIADGLADAREINKTATYPWRAGQ